MNDILFTITASSCNFSRADGEFSTHAEWFPWWQSDFETSIHIQDINIQGLAWAEKQHPLLTLLVSEDNEHWLPVWTQALHAPEDKENFHIHLSQPFCAKYIKLRADSYGILHFKNINLNTQPIVGNEQKPQQIIHEVEQKAASSTIILATLFNESDEFLSQYINNFLAYTPQNVHLVLNFPQGRTIPQSAHNINNRIHVFNGHIQRHKWGNTLLLGYIEAFEEAEKLIPHFDYFATMASNGLMVRPFDIAQTLMQLPLKQKVPVACERAYENDINVNVIEPTHKGAWMWHHFRLSEGLGQYIKDQMYIERASITQIEGLFAHRSDWKLLQEARPLVEGLSPYMTFDFYLAIEELIPISIFNNFGSGQHTHICKVLWKSTRQVELDDLFNMAPHLPEQICALKWFDRSVTSEPTMLVATDWGRQLLNLTQNKNDIISNFKKTNLISNLAKQFNKQQKYGALTNRWWDNDQDAEVGLYWSSTDIICQRQQIDLPVPNAKKFHASPAFLFLEDNQNILSCIIRLQENWDKQTKLYMSCTADNANHDKVSGVYLQGYLYLSPMQGDTIFKISIHHNACRPRHTLDRIVIYDEYGYSLVQPNHIEHENEVEHLYYACSAPTSQGQVWLGIPLYCNALIDITLSIGSNFTNLRPI